MSLSLRSFVLLVATASMVFGHSMMMCAKYDQSSGTCAAPVRNAVVAAQMQDYIWDGASNDVCQSSWVNPITSYYSNGAGCPDYAGCPDPMGTYTPGETFSVMWYARNHATPDQNPGNVQVYLSPKESANQGADTSASTLMGNLLCEGPFSNCLGPNVDQTPCVLSCTLPANTPSGIYTLLWQWHWINGPQNHYTTCADISVLGGGSNPSPPTNPPSPLTTGKKPVTPITSGKPVTPITSGKAPITSGKIAPVTSGKPAPVTTGKPTPVTTGKPPKNAPSPAPVPNPPSPVTYPPSPVSDPPASSSCTLGAQRCVDSHTYQTCSWASRTETGWSTVQACPTGLTCTPVQGSYIWCE